jgi:hypothetical protein
VTVPHSVRRFHRRMLLIESQERRSSVLSIGDHDLVGARHVWFATLGTSLLAYGSAVACSPQSLQAVSPCWATVSSTSVQFYGPPEVARFRFDR